MRSCLPLTALSQELVERSFLSESVREELRINETEHKMIHGSVPPGWARPGSPGLRPADFYGMMGCSVSALEQRIASTIFLPRGAGKTTLWQHMMQKFSELGKLPSLVTTDAEVSRGFPSSRWKAQTRNSVQPTLQSYAVWDSIMTAKHLVDQHKYPVRRADYGDEVWAEHVMMKNRQFVLNFDQLGGGK